jgi:hypothetical protein
MFFCHVKDSQNSEMQQVAMIVCHLHSTGFHTKMDTVDGSGHGKKFHAIYPTLRHTA